VVPLTVGGHGSNNLTITFVSMDANSRLSLDDVALVRTDTVVPFFPMVCNGGFEAGTFVCWQDSGYTDNVYVSSHAVAGVSPHSGYFFAALGSSEAYNSLQQQVWVSSDATYLVSYWVAVGTEDSTASNALFAYDTHNSQSYIFGAVGESPAEGYVQHLAVVSMPGESGPQQLEVSFLSYDDHSSLGLDDVSIVPAVNLIQNSGFETGDFTSWQLSGNTSHVDVSSYYEAYSGSYSAVLGASVRPNTLSQTVTDSQQAPSTRCSSGRRAMRAPRPAICGSRPSSRATRPNSTSSWRTCQTTTSCTKSTWTDSLPQESSSCPLSRR
jgi:hypothetical protein